MTPDDDGAAEDDDPVSWRCYRHPDREAGVRCRRCERAICPSCMITAPVGFQCPGCVRQAPPVRTLRSLQTRPTVTIAVVALNLAVLVVSLGSIDVIDRYGLYGPAVAAGDWWRLVTSGFVHSGLLHAGFNCFLLYQLGELLEPSLGRLRFAALYAVALAGGSFGVLLLDPGALTVGASGAVFGVLGASVLALRRRGISPMQSGLGGLLAVNLLLTFAVPGISIGGHLGGLVVGGAAGGVLLTLDRRPAQRLLGVGAVAAAAIALLVGAAYLAAHPL